MISFAAMGNKIENVETALEPEYDGREAARHDTMYINKCQNTISKRDGGKKRRKQFLTFQTKDSFSLEVKMKMIWNRKTMILVTSVSEPKV